MKTMRFPLLVCLPLLCCAQRAYPQAAVIDAFNGVFNLTTSLQAVLQTANMILELTGLDDFDLGDDYSADLQEMAGILTDASSLAQDGASLNSQITVLFNLQSAPRTAKELRIRMAEMRAVLTQAYLTALRTQTLVRSTLTTVKHLTSLVSRIAALTGNMQANQVLNQYQAKLNQTLATLQFQTAAFQRAQTLDRAQEAMVLESLEHINAASWADHPGIGAR